MLSWTYRRMRVAASAYSPALEGELVRMSMKKSRAEDVWRAGLPSWARCGAHASQIAVASAMGMGGVMRARAMSRSGMSRRRWKRREMPPRSILEAPLMRGAYRKASMAAWRSSSSVGNIGAAEDPGGGVSLMVSGGSGSVGGCGTVGFYGGS